MSSFNFSDPRCTSEMFCCNGLRPSIHPFERINEYRLRIFVYWLKVMSQDKSLISADPGGFPPFVIQVNQKCPSIIERKRYFVPTDWGKFAERLRQAPNKIERGLLRAEKLHCIVHSNIIWLSLYERDVCMSLGYAANTPISKTFSGADKFADSSSSGKISCSTLTSKAGATCELKKPMRLGPKSCQTSQASTPEERTLHSTNVTGNWHSGQSSLRDKPRNTQEQKTSMGQEPKRGQSSDANKPAMRMSTTVKPGPSCPIEASSSESILGITRAREEDKSSPEPAEESNCSHWAHGSHNIINITELEPLLELLKVLADDYVLGLIKLTQQSRGSNLAGVPHQVQIEWTKRFVRGRIDKLRNSVDKDFLSWLRFMAGSHFISFLMSCCPVKKAAEEGRKKITKATRSAIEAIFTSLDFLSTESKVLQEIVRQNPDDKFITLLVNRAFRRIRGRSLQPEKTKLADLPKQEPRDWVIGVGEKQDCILDDSSDDCHWPVVAEPRSESGNLDSFSLCEYSDTDTSLWEASSDEMSLESAERVMNLLKTKGTKVPKEFEMKDAVDS